MFWYWFALEFVRSDILGLACPWTGQNMQFGPIYENYKYNLFAVDIINIYIKQCLFIYYSGVSNSYVMAHQYWKPKSQWLINQTFPNSSIQMI